jgi:hypothetical protein
MRLTKSNEGCELDKNHLDNYTLAAHTRQAYSADTSTGFAKQIDVDPFYAKKSAPTSLTATLVAICLDVSTLIPRKLFLDDLNRLFFLIQIEVNQRRKVVEIIFTRRIEYYSEHC